MNTETYIRSLMSLTREEIGDRMRFAEVRQGFAIISEAPWFERNDWTPFTIVSVDKNRVRLVALEAKQPGNGAFTRLISEISKAGFVPVVVEPNDMLTDWCKRHYYRKRTLKRGSEFQHDVWYPKTCGY